MITNEQTLLYGSRIAITTMILLTSVVILKQFASLEVMMVLYLGPFLTTLYVVEHMERKYNINPKAWLREKWFFISTLVWQSVTFFTVVFIYKIEMTSGALIIAMQTVFSVAAVYLSNVYAKIRNRKKAK